MARETLGTCVALAVCAALAGQVRAAPVGLDGRFSDQGGSAETAPDMFEIENTSSPGFQIISVTIDLSTAAIAPNAVFDVVAGGLGIDPAYAFDVPLAPGVDSVVETVVDGGQTLQLDFTGFDPTEAVEMTIDVDGTARLLNMGDAVGTTITATFRHASGAMGTFSSTYGNPSEFGVYATIEGDIPLTGDPIPEPATLALLGLAGATLACVRRRRAGDC